MLFDIICLNLNDLVVFLGLFFYLKLLLLLCGCISICEYRINVFFNYIEIVKWYICICIGCKYKIYI